MRRAVLALVASAVLTLAGLIIAPTMRATALGETTVTLNCSDGTSVSLVVDAAALAGLTEAVRAMAEYPAGLSCTIVQNLVTLPFGNIALAATTNSFVVAGGRWQVECSVIAPGGFETFVGSGNKSARLITDGRAAWSQTETCVDATGCIFINIAVNAHVTGQGAVQGTLNQTIPENQFCPTNNGPLQIGPSHFTSKPVCYDVDLNKAFVNSEVTQTSGRPFPRGAGSFGLTAGDIIQFGFEDGGNPPQPVDRLNGPPLTASIVTVPPVGECPGPAPVRFMSNGNISVRP